LAKRIDFLLLSDKSRFDSQPGQPKTLKCTILDVEYRNRKCKSLYSFTLYEWWTLNKFLRRVRPKELKSWYCSRACCVLGQGALRDCLYLKFEWL